MYAYEVQSDPRSSLAAFFVRCHDTCLLSLALSDVSCSKNMRQIELISGHLPRSKTGVADVTQRAGFNLLTLHDIFKRCHFVYRECSLTWLRSRHRPERLRTG